MSKLNRKEFKALLSEWKQNFINEKGENRKYHLDQTTQTGHLVTPEQNELKGIIEFIQEYIEENDDVKDLKDILQQEHLEYFFDGIVFPKNSQIINMFENFFLFTSNEERAEELNKARKDNECVIIHFTEGDFNIDFKKQTKQDIYNWTIHDIEHTLLSPITSVNLYFCNSVLDIVKNNLENSDMQVSNKMTMYDILSKGGISEHWLEVNEKILVHKFFKYIDHTPTVGLDDLHASIMSFCYIKMKNKDDILTIDNLEENIFPEEEKNKLKEIFKSSYDITQEAFSNLKSILENCIVLVVSA